MQPPFLPDISGENTDPHLLGRREFLLLSSGATIAPGLLGLMPERVSAAAAIGGVRVLHAVPARVDIGGRARSTWSYDGRLPGPELRVQQGERVRVRIENRLPEPTTIHWHGVRLRNAMDGVPGLTQPAVAPGQGFLYDFVPPDAGTFLFHSHVGTQLDRGLYGALIVEPKSEPLSYDREAVLLFDDWLDGISGTPDEQLSYLRTHGMKMGGMNMGGASIGGANMGGMTMGAHTTLAGGKPGADDLALLANRLESGQDDPGDVRYPLYLINGRPPTDPQTLILRAGDVVRLRLINAAADTIFCVFVEGHPLTVVHADGQPVDPVMTDALVIGMGERYDVLVTARTSGLARIIGVPLGKHGRAQALLRTGPRPGRPPSPTAPFRMPRRIVGYGDLHDGQLVASPSDVVEHRFDLTQIAGRYAWAVGSEVFGKAPPIELARGQAVRFVLRNRGAMPHPMHLHGHFFRAVNRRGTGLSKDTILVLPHRQLAIEFAADNPGRWAFHCHNVYHQEAGMMREINIA